MTASEEEEVLLIAAALRIQCVFRVARARRERAAKMVQRQMAFEQQCEDDLAVNAAVTLQAAQRRKIALARTEKIKQQGDLPVSKEQHGQREPTLAVEPPSLHASVSVSEKPGATGGGSEEPPPPLAETGSTPRLSASPSQQGGRGGSSVTFVRTGGSPKVGSGNSGIHVGADVSFAEVLKSGVYESSASFMGASVYGREGLTTAFALSSVASFAMLMRDDPSAANEIKAWDPASLNHTLIHECASMVIQAKWRVHEARVKVMRLKRERAQARSKANNQELEEVSARAIQSNFRGHAVRARSPSGPHERKRASSVHGGGAPASESAASARQARRPLTPNGAAVKIQSRHRTAMAKQEVERRRVERKAEFNREVEASLLDDAARTIQATQRRHAEQRRRSADLKQTAAPPTGVAGEVAATSSSSAPSKLRTAVAAAAVHVPAGSGHGLSAVFYSAMSALLERTPAPTERCMFWGVRVLHTVTMDMALEAASSSSDGAGNDDEPRLPNLEVSRWVQGPLGSVVPLTAKVGGRADAARRGNDNGTSPRGRLPALQHTGGGGGGKGPGPSSNEPSPSTPSPSKKQLAPLKK